MNGYNSVLDAYKQQIDTLTQLDAKIAKQKFYEVSISDYVDVDEGNGAFADSIFKYISFDTAGDGFNGFADENTNQAKMPAVNVALQGRTDLRHIWNKYVSYNIKDLEQLKRTGSYDLISSKLEARKRNYDLMLQEIAFLGNKMFADNKGLLTNDEATVNLNLIPTFISLMTPAQLQEFASKLIGTYRQQCNYTAMPNRLIVPDKDYTGLGAPYDPNFAIKSRMEYLEEAIKSITHNDFKILPSAYSQKDVNGKTNTYALYNKNPDTLVFDVPVAYTTTAFNTVDNYTFQNVGYGQVGGVRVFRPREILYFTNNQD